MQLNQLDETHDAAQIRGAGGTLDLAPPPKSSQLKTPPPPPKPLLELEAAPLLAAGAVGAGEAAVCGCDAWKEWV